MITNRDYLSNSIDTIKGLIQTYQESVTLAKKSKRIMIPLIKKSYGIDDERIVDSIYNFYILNINIKITDHLIYFNRNSQHELLNDDKNNSLYSKTYFTIEGNMKSLQL